MSCRKPGEWDSLAAWAKKFNVYSKHLRASISDVVSLLGLTVFFSQVG
jgi:hypothetical protein